MGAQFKKRRKGRFRGFPPLGTEPPHRLLPERDSGPSRRAIPYRIHPRYQMPYAHGDSGESGEVERFLNGWELVEPTL